MTRSKLLIIIVHLTIGKVSPLYGDNNTTTQCKNAFLNDENFKTTGINTRTYTTYNKQTEKCKKTLLAMPEFRASLNSVIAEYESFISKGITVDKNIYLSMNTLLKKKLDKEKLNKIEKNSAQAQLRCDGDNSKDLRDKLPKIRDQGSIGWCYAFTVADLVSFYSGKNISARHIALTNNTALNQEKQAYGFYNSVASILGQKTKTPLHHEKDTTRSLKDTFFNLRTPSRNEGDYEDIAFLRNIARGGFCLEKDIPTKDPRNRDLGEVISIFNSFDQLQKQQINQSDKVKSAQVFCYKNINLIKDYFPQHFGKNILNILIKSAEQGDSFNFLSDHNCKKETSVSHYKTYRNYKMNDGDIISHIDQLLNKNEIVSITYNPLLIGSSNDEQNADYHSSTIVGRKYDKKNGRCQYLIRNSWGSDCNQYPKTANIACENGHLWAYEDEVDRHTSSSLEIYK